MYKHIVEVILEALCYYSINFMILPYIWMYRFYVIVPSIRTLVISGFDQNMWKYRQRDDSQKLAKSVSNAVLTVIDLYSTKVVTCFSLHIHSSICVLRFCGKIFTF